MFFCDSLTKRLLKSPLAQRQCRSETRPFAAPHTTERGGSLLGWPRAVGNSTMLWDLGELAPEQLPWDVSSRKPSRTSFPFDPEEAVLRASPRVPRAPVLPSLRVPSLLQLLPHCSLETTPAHSWSVFLRSFCRVGRHKEWGAGRITPSDMPVVTFILNRLAGGCNLWPERAN